MKFTGPLREQAPRWFDGNTNRTPLPPFHRHTPIQRRQQATRTNVHASWTLDEMVAWDLTEETAREQQENPMNVRDPARRRRELPELDLHLDSEQRLRLFNAVQPLLDMWRLDVTHVPAGQLIAFEDTHDVLNAILPSPTLRLRRPTQNTANV